METVTNNSGCPKKLQAGVAVIGWLGAMFSIFDIIIIIISLFTGVFTEKEIANVFVTLGTFLLQAEISICLIIAVERKRSRISVSWLMVSIIHLILLSIVFLISGVNLHHLPLILQTIMVGDAIGLSFWVCVYSSNQKVDQHV